MRIVPVKPVDVRPIEDRTCEVDRTIGILVPIPAEMPFPDHGRMIPRATKHVRKSRPTLRDQMLASTVQDTSCQPRSPVVSTGEQSISSGRTDRAGRVGIQKSDSLIRQSLKLRRLNLAARMGRSDITNAQIICHDQHHIGA